MTIKSRVIIAATITSTLLVTLIWASALPFGFSQNSTNVTGTINSNTAWTKANSPYNLTGPVTIDLGATLTIEAGATANLNGYHIQVNGNFILRGTRTDKIYINGGGISDQIQWYDEQLYFTMYSTGIIENAVITLTSPNAIYIETTSTQLYSNVINGDIWVNGVLSAPTISNNTITGQILISGGSSTISNNTVRGTVSATGSCTISNNTILGNGEDEGVFTGGDKPVVSNNIISGCKIGIRAYYSSTIEKNLVANNSRYGIDVGIGSHFIRNNTIANNTIGINSPKPTSTIIYNNIVNNSKYNIYLDTYSVYSVVAPNNWWGTTDIPKINQTINSKYNNLNLVTVNFIPILTMPNPQATPNLNLDSNPSPTAEPTSAPMPSPTPSLSPSPTIPEFPKWIVVLVIVVASAALIAYKRKKRAK